MRFSLPPAKKAICWPSGAKNGLSAPSVPGKAVACASVSAPSRRRYSWRRRIAAIPSHERGDEAVGRESQRVTVADVQRGAAAEFSGESQRLQRRRYPALGPQRETHGDEPYCERRRPRSLPHHPRPISWDRWPTLRPRVRPGLGDNPRDRDARLADGLKALPRILRQTTPNQRTDRWWDSRWQRADGGIALDDARQCGGRRVARIERPACQHLAEDHAEGPQVRSFVGSLTLRLLRRHVRRCPENHPRPRHPTSSLRVRAWHSRPTPDRGPWPGRNRAP